MFTPINVKIVLLTDRANAQGLFPIYLQYSQNRKINRISLRKWIDQNQWLDTGSTFVKSLNKDSLSMVKQLNLFLRSQLNRAQEIILEHQRKEEPLSFQKFKNAFVNTQGQDFFAFCENELQRRGESEKFSPQTLRGNWSRLNKLRGFRRAINFSDITLRFLEDYETYLRVKLNNDVNTIFTAMKFIRTMLNQARKQKLTKVYPFDEYKIVYKKNTRDRLTAIELKQLQALYDQHTLPDHLQNVLQYFLFACYTGLSWGDLESLSYGDVQDHNGQLLIEKERSKNGQRFIVPLLKEAKQLLPSLKGEGPIFTKMISNQKANEAIKKIIAATKIRKQVSFHVARHTFATVALNYGIPREAIQKMLGHSKEDMTRLYSKMMDTTVLEEMKKWGRGEVVSTSSNFQEKVSSSTLNQYKRFRTQLIAARIAGGLEVKDLAQQIGLDADQYRLMESGKAPFNVVEVIEVARLLQLQMIDLW